MQKTHKPCPRRLTATAFAVTIGISKPTILKWLRRGLIPGAEWEVSPRGGYWQIPENVTLAMIERPRRGRPRKT